MVCFLRARGKAGRPAPAQAPASTAEATHGVRDPAAAISLAVEAAHRASRAAGCGTGVPPSCRRMNVRKGFSRGPLFLFGLNVNAAFEFALALPAAGTRIVRVERQVGARLAPDAGVAHIVERQRRDVGAAEGGPHVAVGPRGRRAFVFDSPSGSEL